MSLLENKGDNICNNDKIVSDKQDIIECKMDSSSPGCFQQVNEPYISVKGGKIE
jgi:hypothetical protein